MKILLYQQNPFYFCLPHIIPIDYVIVPQNIYIKEMALESIDEYTWIKSLVLPKIMFTYQHEATLDIEYQNNLKNIETLMYIIEFYKQKSKGLYQYRLKNN